jgi:hypothetical protein
MGRFLRGIRDAIVDAAERKVDHLAIATDIINPFDGSNPIFGTDRDTVIEDAVNDPIGFLKDVANPFDGSNPLLQGLGTNLSNLTGVNVTDIINPFDGSYPILDATGKVIGWAANAVGNVLGNLGGGGGGGGGAEPPPPPPAPPATCGSSGCYEQCQLNDEKLHSLCEQLTREFIADLRVLGCKGATCNVPRVEKTCSMKRIREEDSPCRRKKSCCASCDNGELSEDEESTCHCNNNY